MDTDRRRIIRQIPYLSRSEMSVLLYIEELTHGMPEDAMATVSLSEFARDTRMDKDNIIASTKRLEMMGFLLISSSPGMSNQYGLNLLAAPKRTSTGNPTGDVELPPRRGHDWSRVLGQDPRWPEGDLSQWREQIEAAFPKVDLQVEALHCYEWLQTKKGQTRIDLKLTFLNWLKKAALQTSEQPRSSAKRRTASDDEIAEDEKRWGT